MARQPTVLQTWNAQFEKGVLDGVIKTNEDVAEAIAEGAKLRAPYDEGELIDSIKVGKVDNTKAVIKMAAHGYWVEHGSADGTLPAPFMRPASNAAKRILIHKLKKNLPGMGLSLVGRAGGQVNVSGLD